MNNVQRNKNKLSNKKKPMFKGKKKAGMEKEEIDKLQQLKLKLGDLNPAEISTFGLLPLSEKTHKGLLKNNFSKPTKVQRQTLIHSLRGLDVVAAAKTGSGKTLAFVIPLLEFLYSKLWSNLDGLGAIIITPTRELAYQIFEVINKVGKHHSFSVGLVIGGKDLKFEWTRIYSCNILICTPGRLLQHMTENPDFNCDSVQILVLDEADQCLSMGFADTMNLILEELPSEKQTLLFSATQTRNVKDLIRAGCKDPVFCSVHEYSKTTTPKTLNESYIVCNDYDKITFLWSFIKYHQKHKILVFLSTCKQVKFFHNLFTLLRAGLIVMGLHGDMHQLRRMAIYDEFCNKKKGLLFATDVAARGLDIPAVDWVIQNDCPEDVTAYIHRVGRTARHAMSGEALLLLTPAQEEAMVACLKMNNIPINKIDVEGNKLHSIQQKVELSLSKHLNLKEDAERAFKAYLKNIVFMKNRKVFDVTAINLDMLARSFGLSVTPRLRFLEKRLKNNSSKKSAASTSDSTLDPKAKTLKTFNLGLSEDDQNDDDFLVQSRRHPSDQSKSEDILSDLTLFMRKEHPLITKSQLAKKAMKNKIQLNKRVVFDDEDDHSTEVNNQEDRSEEAADNQNISGIDISEMQVLMKEQDKVDKRLNAQRLKEKHRHEKEKLRRERTQVEEMWGEEHEEGEMEGEEGEMEGEEGEMEGGDSEGSIDDFTMGIIDALPDPDKFYRKEDTDAGSDNASENETEWSPPQKTEEDKKTKMELKRKRKGKEGVKKRKRQSAATENDLSGISVNEKEDLAMFLLKGGVRS